MIRIVGEGELLAPEELVGKYVMRDGGMLWPTLTTPRIVVRVSGRRAYLDREQSVWDDDAKLHRLTGKGEREPDGHISVSSIRCVCDTAAEVNEAMAVSATGQRDFSKMIEKAKARLWELHGLERS